MAFHNLIFDLICVNLAPIQDSDPLIAAQLRVIIIPRICRFDIERLMGYQFGLIHISFYGRQMRLFVLAFDYLYLGAVSL